MTLPLFLVVGMAFAQGADRGYVVRADSAAVWLDLSAADGAAPGRAFEVYTEGEELKHPKTGASLGRVQEKLAEGRVASVAEKHSSGTLSSGAGVVKPGQRVRWTSAAPSPSVETAAARAAAPEGSRPAKTRGATLPFAVNGMAAGDFDGSGKPQLALAADKTVSLYSYPATDGKPLAETTLSGTGVRVLSLESGDLDGNGRAELFVSLYDDAFRRFETRVLERENGEWKKRADLPFLVRAYQDETGKRVLASQQIVDDKTFPFGGIFPLAYRDGKWVQGSPSVKAARADWLYGFTTAKLGEGEPATFYVTNVRALRVQLGKKHWRTSDDDYQQSPVRVRWDDRLFEFHPPMLTRYDAAGSLEALYAARNIAALGGLASPFGLFTKSVLLAQKWNGLALEPQWRSELPGCVQGMALVEAAPGVPELAVAIRGSAGQSTVWTFAP
jgi:hypothetical protein